MNIPSEYLSGHVWILQKTLLEYAQKVGLGPAVKSACFPDLCWVCSAAWCLLGGTGLTGRNAAASWKRVQKNQ